MKNLRNITIIALYVKVTVLLLFGVYLIPEESSKYLYIVLPSEQSFAQNTTQIFNAGASIVSEGSVKNSYVVYSEHGNLSEYFNKQTTILTLNPIFAQGCNNKRFRMDA